MASNDPPPPESLSGLIERVTFFNEENGFAVLKVKVKGRGDEVTVVGSLASVNPGEWLTAEGRWVRDREFGLQFRADLLKIIDSAGPHRERAVEISNRVVSSAGDNDLIERSAGLETEIVGIAFDLHRTEIQRVLFLELLA